jgi:hypothetical protein
LTGLEFEFTGLDPGATYVVAAVAADSSGNRLADADAAPAVINVTMSDSGSPELTGFAVSVEQNKAQSTFDN